MRYRLPEGCHSVTLDGVPLATAADGIIEADVSAAADLAPHGIVPVDDAPPIEGDR